MANSKCKFFYGQQTVSPKGEANYVYINTRVNVVNDDEKGYSITLKFNDKDTKALQQSFQKQLKTIQEEQADLQWQGDAFPGYSEDTEGNPIFKFKSSKKDKNGNWAKVRLVDSKNNQLPFDTEIGSGSIVRAIFVPTVYWVNKKNFGVTLFVDKLQIVKLEEYSGGNGSNLSFPEEDGYVAKVEFPTEDDSEYPI